MSTVFILETSFYLPARGLEPVDYFLAFLMSAMNSRFVKNSLLNIFIYINKYLTGL